VGPGSLQSQLIGARNSWSVQRRELRARWLSETFPDLAAMSVIDLGGLVETWLRAQVRPKHVHVLNPAPPAVPVPEWVEFTCCDACALPDHLANRRYDLVFSNSVIEHVGGHERRLRFAEAVHLLADAHWIQTPYRFFPIEPHWMLPGVQFLPTAVQVALVRRCPLAENPDGNRLRATKNVLWTELLDRTQMRHYFPHSSLRAERLFGLTKSLIAYRAPRP
jgi:Methyltransferase domain